VGFHEKRIVAFWVSEHRQEPTGKTGAFGFNSHLAPPLALPALAGLAALGSPNIGWVLLTAASAPHIPPPKALAGLQPLVVNPLGFTGQGERIFINEP